MENKNKKRPNYSSQASYKKIKKFKPEQDIEEASSSSEYSTDIDDRIQENSISSNREYLQNLLSDSDDQTKKSLMSSGNNYINLMMRYYQLNLKCNFF